MKFHPLVLPLAMVSAMVGAHSAFAGAPVGSWYVSPQAVYVDPDKRYNADENVGASLAIGKVLSQSWDVELGFIDSRHDVLGGGDKLKLTGPWLSFNRVFMRDNTVSPYIGLGLNAIHSRNNGTGDTQRSLGAAIKAGVLADITANGALQLSAEVGKRSDHYSDRLEDVFGGLGLRFNFGGKQAAIPTPPPPPPAPVAQAAPPPPPEPAPPPPPADDDKDGVPNAADRCPRTPAGDRVDSVGCGLKVALEIQFDFNSAVIKPESYTELDNFVLLFKEVPSANGELQGHTDSVGGNAYNLRLSQQRADSVKAYVTSKGVDGSRLRTKGYGESSPIADNKTDEGRSQNRRVLFVRDSMP